MRFPKNCKHIVCSLASYSKIEVFRKQFYFMLLFIRLKRQVASVLIKCSMTVLPSESSLKCIGSHLYFYSSHHSGNWHLSQILVLNFCLLDVSMCCSLWPHRPRRQRGLSFFTIVPSFLFHFTLILVFSFNKIMYRFDCSLSRREGYVAETFLKPFKSL